MNDFGRLRFAITLFAIFALSFALTLDLKKSPIMPPTIIELGPKLGMPVIKVNLPELNGREPIAKRSTRFETYLQCSVKIHVKQGIGSGTICYYDEATNEAYIISCGHLFKGTKKPNQRTSDYAKINVFYKNDYKLDTPQQFDAKVLCYDQTTDLSLLMFKPDWPIQSYFPIAPLDYPIIWGEDLESTGCDGDTPPAAYTVSMVEEDEGNLISKDNSPRPGRSGGGLFSPDGYLIGVVWATSDVSGTGYGFYIPLSRIHAYLSQFDEVAWLLEGGEQWSIINTLPLQKPDGRTGNLPPRYLPLPQSRSTIFREHSGSAMRRN